MQMTFQRPVSEAVPWVGGCRKAERRGDPAPLGDQVHPWKLPEQAVPSVRYQYTC